MKATHRKTLYVDGSVQRPLAIRVASYWLLCLVAIFMFMAAYPVVISACLPLRNAPTMGELFGRTWSVFWPAFAAGVLILPAVVWDVIRMSNRFAGPLHRMRRAMNEVEDGKPFQPIRLRKGDFLVDFVDRFNHLAAQAHANSCPTPAETPDSKQASTIDDEELAESLV